ncbi:hypothetical protein MMC17_005067 [Xylographa soralifera]|nr:hypothetical protein [Xylographa soralifera]
MDPVSAIGIGLAVMSLTAQSFTGAMQAIHLIANARNLKPDFKYLTVRLRLEQQRLYNWSSEIGLLKYLEEDESIPSQGLLGLSRGAILDTLAQIQALAVDFIKCNDTFSGLIPDEDHCDSAALEDNPSKKESNHFPDTMHFLKKTKRSMPLVRGLPRRLKWASFYKDRYESLISRLRDFNDVLIDLVDSDARMAISRSTRETNTTILHLHGKVDELAELIQALVPDKNPEALPILASRHAIPSNMVRAHELAGLAYFKALNTTIQADAFSKTSFNDGVYRLLKSTKIDRSEIQSLLFQDNSNNRCIASYQHANTPQQQVWIEWREYDLAMQANHNGIVYDLTRVEKLVALLSHHAKPELLRAPNCLGYFDNAQDPEKAFRKGRLGFVFEHPFPEAGPPVSLKELLKAKAKPELTKRVALARAISNCLMSLHSVDWLHKDLRSDNVIFFKAADGTIDYSCPLLSGFGYARPAFREDMTEIPSHHPEHDMYRHPRTHRFGPWEGRQGFKRTFDIYSLGIVLLEIADWQTIDEVLNLGNPKTLNDASLANIRKRLLDETVHLDTVGANTGRRFKAATLSCLKGSTAFDIDVFDDETNERVGAILSQNFYWKVIMPLEEIQT